MGFFCCQQGVFQLEKSKPSEVFVCLSSREPCSCPGCLQTRGFLRFSTFGRLTFRTSCTRRSLLQSLFGRCLPACCRWWIGWGALLTSSAPAHFGCMEHADSHRDFDETADLPTVPAGCRQSESESERGDECFMLALAKPISIDSLSPSCVSYISSHVARPFRSTSAPPSAIA